MIKVSPLSFLRFAGNPAARGVTKVEMDPALAASKNWGIRREVSVLREGKIQERGNALVLRRLWLRWGERRVWSW